MHDAVRVHVLCLTTEMWNGMNVHVTAFLSVMGIILIRWINDGFLNVMRFRHNNNCNK